MNADELPIALTGNLGADTLSLRQFRGNAALGWKVAWSDRMISMYGGVWLAALAFAFLPRLRRHRPIAWWQFVLLILPMAVDGATHFISDLSGLTEGFRYQNEWLAALTGGVLGDGFYAGDSLGSFNSWMRLGTGLPFGIGCVGFAFPYIDRHASEVVQYLTVKIDRVAQLQTYSADLLKEWHEQSRDAK